MKSQSFVQAHAFVVRQCNASKGRVKALAGEPIQELSVERPAYATAMSAWGGIDRHIN
nr:hypothetical protein [Phenylobacterium sp.]